MLEECDTLPERQFFFALLEKLYDVAFSQNPELMMDGNTYLIASYLNKLRENGDFLGELKFNQAMLSSPFVKETLQGIRGYLEIMNLKNPTTLPWKEIMYQNPEVTEALTKCECQRISLPLADEFICHTASQIVCQLS